MSVNIKDNTRPNGLLNIAGKGANDGPSYDQALSLEEIEASTDEMLENKIPNAKAVKELNRNLTESLSYNPETDYFGMVYEGVWRDVVSAGFKTPVALVPEMQSDTVPSGRVLYSSQWNANLGNAAWSAFRESTQGNPGWAQQGSGSASGQYIGYQFDQPVRVTRIRFSRYDSANFNIKGFTFQALDNSGGWKTLYTGVMPNDEAMHYLDIPNPDEYSAYRILVSSSYVSHAGIRYLQFYGYKKW